MSVNKIEKTLNPYAEKGKKGIKKGNPGRPKGAKGKVTKNIKENFEAVFEKLGGIDGFFKWAKTNNNTKATFYQMYSKMLPSNVAMEHSSSKINPLQIIVSNNGSKPEKTANENKTA